MRLFGTPKLLRRFVPKGLLGRFLLILIMPLVIVQGVTAFFFFERHWDTVMRRLGAGIAGDVAMVVDLMERFPAPEDYSWIFDAALQQMDLDVVFRPDEILPNVTVLYKGGDKGSLEGALGPAVRERLRRPVDVDAGMFSDTVTIRVQLATGILEVKAPRKRLYSSTTYIFLFWMVGTAFVVFGIATIFMSNQVRSIRRLASGAESFGKGRDLPPLKLEGAREVRQAGLAFNIMRDRIQRQIAQRTEMLAGVSHDLRTPLTRMKLQVAMMTMTPDLEALSEDITEMERMVEGYLSFARREGQEEAEPFDLIALIETVVSKYRRADATIEFLHPGTVKLFVVFRPGAIERCLSNLVGNALRYGNRARVTVGFEEDKEQVLVAIEDDGPGIPEALREDVFRAFFRSEPSRNPQTGGVGLGLTIARDVARVHGGNVTLHDSEDLGGLKAILRLPM